MFRAPIVNRRVLVELHLKTTDFIQLKKLLIVQTLASLCCFASELKTTPELRSARPSPLVNTKVQLYQYNYVLNVNIS